MASGKANGVPLLGMAGLPSLCAKRSFHIANSMGDCTQRHCRSEKPYSTTPEGATRDASAVGDMEVMIGDSFDTPKSELTSLHEVSVSLSTESTFWSVDEEFGLGTTAALVPN
ncbi:hypothetical protein SUGI_0284840 [Cryptomeria japonica]|nr:hypothetical protein SUGI_0284840 [Cryptomeria japonica]